MPDVATHRIARSRDRSIGQRRRLGGPSVMPQRAADDPLAAPTILFPRTFRREVVSVKLCKLMVTT